jgi:endoglucanase Acf2
MAHGFPPPFCTGKKFLQDENGKIVKHFLLICPTLNDIREEHLYTLKCYLNNIQEGAYEAICENKQLIQLILDSSMDILKGIVTLTKRNHIDIPNSVCTYGTRFSTTILYR